MDQQAQNIVQKMARARIQQEYKETTLRASSSAGWTFKSPPPCMLCASLASELGSDRSQPVATCGKAEQRHNRGKPSDVPVKQSRGAGFRLVGGVRVRSKDSRVRQRPEGQQPSEKPTKLNRGEVTADATSTEVSAEEWPKLTSSMSTASVEADEQATCEVAETKVVCPVPSVVGGGKWHVVKSKRRKRGSRRLRNSTLRGAVIHVVVERSQEGDGEAGETNDPVDAKPSRAHELSPPTLRHTGRSYRTACAPLEFRHLTDASDRGHRAAPAPAALDDLTLDGTTSRMRPQRTFQHHKRPDGGSTDRQTGQALARPRAVKPGQARPPGQAQRAQRPASAKRRHRILI
ncbi:hypothetical protein HPB47_013691 [Ixodes persulcatus]|uniref:Uncharacterized protein n=1 Tax=Ixodes persulcatus TaxID=34615 RepID=A0AC60QXV8_IXOPE|nr:hypothetical protein HPB47_013691 [Ixodes persulcatus]